MWKVHFYEDFPTKLVEMNDRLDLAQENQSDRKGESWFEAKATE